MTRWLVAMVSLPLVMICSLHALAQSAAPKSAAEAAAEARRAAATCAAMPAGNQQATGCVTVCTRNAEGMSTVKPNFIATLLESCTTRLAQARSSAAFLAQGAATAPRAPTSPAVESRPQTPPPPAEARTTAPPRPQPTPAAAATRVLLTEMGARVDNGGIRAVYEGEHPSGDNQAFRTVFMTYVKASDRYCGANTPNGAAVVERTTTYVEQNGWDVDVDRSTTTWTVDKTLADTFMHFAQTLPPNFSLNAMPAFLEHALQAKADFTRLFGVWQCNGPQVRQFQENLRRTANGLLSLQAQRDSELPMPLIAQQACQEYLDSPRRDPFGYVLTSCGCFAKHVGKGMNKAYVTAMDARFDSAQVVLLGYVHKKPELVRECLIKDERAPSATSAGAAAAAATAPGDRGPPYRENPFGGPGADALESVECEAAKLEVQRRVLGANACAVTPAQVERTAQELTRVLKSTCGLRGGSLTADGIQRSVVDDLCALQREGGPSEEEALLAQRMASWGACLPVSHPAVQVQVRYIMERVRRQYLGGRLAAIAPILANEREDSRNGKLCTARYLREKWLPE